MGQKLVVGPIKKGLKTFFEPFNIDNDSFPVLVNAYQWRGRVKRKRGTKLLGRLQRFFNSLSAAYTSFTDGLFDGTGKTNLFTGAGSFHLEANATLVPGSLTLTDVATGEVYTDLLMNGTLQGSLGNTGTINYSTGAIVIATSAGDQFTATFVYNPSLPVMGLELLKLNPNVLDGTLAFDTKYSYNISTIYPYLITDVSFYKNPSDPLGLLPGYIPKAVWTPTTWNGQDYQQFWTVNYEDALWATNGINIPFSITNIGMQFKPITGMLITLATAPNGPSIVTLTIAAHGLVVGDFLFINEVNYTVPNTTNSINFQTGYVIAIIDANNVSVEFPNAFLTGIYVSGGIAQYLTNRADTTIDSLRWYDGDPTDGVIPPTFILGKGWVNFSPPLSQFSFSIANLPPKQYYLVGARMIVPFKDRLLMFGPVVQTSSAGSQVYLPDTVIYSQNGTPYYTASFTGDPLLASTVFFPVLTPTFNIGANPLNQVATPSAWWEDQTGFGGSISLGISDSITSVASNEDNLIVG